MQQQPLKVKAVKAEWFGVSLPAKVQLSRGFDGFTSAVFAFTHLLLTRPFSLSKYHSVVPQAPLPTRQTVVDQFQVAVNRRQHSVAGTVDGSFGLMVLVVRLEQRKRVQRQSRSRTRLSVFVSSLSPLRCRSSGCRTSREWTGSAPSTSCCPPGIGRVSHWKWICSPAGSGGWGGTRA